MNAKNQKKRFTIALAGTMVFGGGSIWGQEPASSYALPQPRIAVVGSPAPIASTNPFTVGQTAPLTGGNPVSGMQSGPPRTHSLDLPPVISTTANNPATPSSQENIIQTQNTSPPGSASSGSGFTFPKPFLSRPSGPTISSPASGATILPGNGSPQILAAPGASIGGGGAARLPSLPAADGQISGNAGITNQPMTMSTGQGMMVSPGQVIYPQQQQNTSFGNKIWNWMNPHSAGATGVTTLPIMAGAEGGTIVNGPTVSGPLLANPGMTGNVDGAMVFPEGTYMEGGDFWGMGTIPNMASGGRCNSRTKFFFDAELLLWVINGQDLPPLVTYGSTGDPVSGAMGQPGTVVAYGNSPEDTYIRTGGRFTAGWWFGERNIVGVDAQYLFLGEQDQTNVFQGFGNTVTVGRPFTDAITGKPAAERVFQPGNLAGTVTVNSVNNFQGANLNLRWGLIRRPKYVMDLQTGGRWMRFDEDLGIYENLAVINSKGSGFLLSDQFNTNNTFYGFNLGLLNTIYLGRFNLGLNAKLAVGNNNQTVDIYGNTIINEVTSINSYNGGLLAQPSNIGQYTQSKLTVIPELEFQLGYQISQRWRFTVGYNFMYWSNIVRPGSIIDPVVNPNQIPSATGGSLGGPPRPAFTWNTTDLFIQGANIGLEFRY